MLIRVQLWHGQFTLKDSQETTQSSPLKARYGMSFVCSNLRYIFHLAYNIESDHIIDYTKIYFESVFLNFVKGMFDYQK